MMLLLAVALLLLQSCHGAWCPRACRCDRSTTGDLEVLCPESQDIAVLSVTVKPAEFAQFQCTRAARPEDYQMLEGLKVGQVPTVNFVQCPLPNDSFHNLTKAFGIESISSILFQSFGNLSFALKQRHLDGLTNVTRLRLSSNNFTIVPENLLKDLHKLTSLDMSDNNFETLPMGLFDALPLLTSLELGNNRLTTLQPGFFGNLSKLTLLNLWSSRLKAVSGRAFANLSNLESLDLHSNDFESLPVDLFDDLKNLKSLNLFGNNLTALPEGLLSKTTSLRVLGLYNNQQQLTLPSKFLSNLTLLEEVYLMKSNLKVLPSDLFIGSYEITNLSLNGNYLSELHEDLLADQRKLELLDLSYNDLDKLPDRLFRNLNELKILRLANNRIEKISRGLLKGLKKLIELDFEHNQLTMIDNLAFVDQIALQQARFSHNRLSFLNSNGFTQGGLQYSDILGNRSPFHSCQDLEYLYLANNSIKEIFYDWKLLLLKLRVLDLSFNQMEMLVAEDIQFIAPELSVDLRHNRISTTRLFYLPILAQSQGPSSDPQRGTPRVLLEGNPIHCDCQTFVLAQYIAELLPIEVYNFVQIVPGDLRCVSPLPLYNRLLTEVSLMELLCPLMEGCPEPCNCAVRPLDNAAIVNCTARGLTQVPKAMPMVKFTNHTELKLEDNEIIHLPNKTLPGYANVTHLFLEGNKLRDVDLRAFSPNLTVLTLDRNNITRMSSATLKFMSNSSELRLVTLHSNPWMCDCASRELLSWLQLKFKKVAYFGNVSCADGRSLVKLSAGDLCPAPLGLVLGCAVIAACGIVAGAAAAFYYRYNHAIRVWLYAHRWCLWLVTEQELDRHKRYDAFVSFSHKDEDFVINTLVPRLEGSGLKLCLHYRDWVAGEWIPTQIARSVEDSRRTLVILSPNFLDSVWGRLEFRAAHKQALSEGRARVVMLLYGDLPPTEQLDPELKAYISVNTYVKWGDPWFWDKLNYALPHAPLRKRKRKEDRMELIIPTIESQGITPSTPPANGICVQSVLQSPAPPCSVEAVT